MQTKIKRAQIVVKGVLEPEEAKSKFNLGRGDSPYDHLFELCVQHVGKFVEVNVPEGGDPKITKGNITAALTARKLKAEKKYLLTVRLSVDGVSIGVMLEEARERNGERR